MIDLNNFILESNQDLSTILDCVIDEECYFDSTLKFLSENNKLYREYNEAFYRAIVTEDTQEALNEAFSDFFTKAKEIIKKFIEFIKSLFKRFVTTLNRMVGSAKHIEKNEKLFLQFNGEHEFEFDGYKFTIEPNIPVMDALEHFNQNFIKISFSELKSKGQDSEKKKYVKGLHDNLKENLEDKYDEYRAKTIGRSEGKIYQSEYASELFELFRDGYDSTHVFTVDRTVIDESLVNFKSYKKDLKEVETQKNQLEKEYKQIEKQIDNLISCNKSKDLKELDINSVYDGTASGVTVNNETLVAINNYVKTLVTEVTQLSSIHSMAFSYKLDALKDRYTQDKKILYIALSKIEKDKELRGVLYKDD